MQKSVAAVYHRLDTINKTSYERLGSSSVSHCILFINSGLGTWIHISLICGHFITVGLIMEFITPWVFLK